MSIGTRKHFQKILFPVDFSPKCMAMAPSVARVASQFGSEVILLHALNRYVPQFIALACFIPVLTALSVVLLRKQEK